MTSDPTNPGAHAQPRGGKSPSLRAQGIDSRELQLERAYAASASQDIAMAQETQATGGDGLSRDYWCGSPGLGSTLVEIGRCLAGVELDLRRDPSLVRVAGFDGEGRTTP